MTELRPCPFCGGEAKLVRANNSWHKVICCKCTGSAGSWRTVTRQEAIEAWNRRVGDGK